MRNKFIQVLFILLAAVGQLQAQAPLASDSLPRGSVIERVECAGAKNHNYALYLPKAYTPEHAWPVMFAFDPGARGSIPVKMMTELAEKYGFIVAGSNTSRNGPISDQVEAADAMMQDVSKRFPLNPKRLYTTGFSGGARIATLVAQLCGDCIAGVFAHGAGFTVTQPPDKKYPFDVFVSIGDLDFNYPELIQLERTLDKLEVANHLAQFSGPHQWAPPEIWVQAFAWLELRGMAAGRIPGNKELVAQQLSTREELARSLEQKGDLYGAWNVYHKIPGEFQALADTSADSKKAVALENSIEWKKARKQEQTELDRQATLTNAVLEVFRNKLDDRPVLASDDRTPKTMLESLRRDAERESDLGKRRAAKRTVGQIFAFGYEEGLTLLSSNQPERALRHFELSREAQPESPAPHYLLARAFARMNKKSQMLSELKLACERGLDADVPRANSDFAVWKDTAEFKKVLETAPRPASK